MTAKEAFALTCETIERKLDETVRKWGYTVEKGGDAGWVCWQIAELSPYEIVSVTKFDAYIRLWRPTNQVCRIYSKHFTPKELEHAVGLFVSRALERAILALAHEELRETGVDDIWRGSSALRVHVNSEAFSLKFKLGKKFWSWKVVSDEGATAAIIRRPLSEHPIERLLEAARYFSLFLL